MFNFSWYSDIFLTNVYIYVFTDKTENTLTISSYIKIKEQINPSDLNQSSYLLNNENNSQVYHWTKRLLHKDYDAQNSNKIKLTDNAKLNAFAIQLFTMKPEYESRWDLKILIFYYYYLLHVLLRLHDRCDFFLLCPIKITDYNSYI